MPTPSKFPTLQMTHHRWKVTLRKGTHYADGRTGNPVNVGRHSLGTTDYEQALAYLRELDRRTYQELNAVAGESAKTRLTMDQGRQSYEKKIGRSKIAGGVRSSSATRYKAVLDNFFAFAKKNSVFFWDEVTADVLSDYLDFAERSGKQEGTLYLEGTTVKQVVKHLISKKLLPRENEIELKIPRPQGTSRYCPTLAEVTRLRQEAMADPKTLWMADVILGLMETGMRQGELIQLDWSDIEEEANGDVWVVVRHEDGPPPSGGQTEPKSTKSGTTRRIPVWGALKPFLKLKRGLPKDLVFTSPDGKRLKQDDVRHALTKLAEQVTGSKRSKVPGTLAAITPHSFRHFFVSECCRQGVAERVVMKWVGHRDSKLVQHYFHLREEASQALMKQLNFGDQGPVRGPSSEVSPLPMVAVTRVEVESMPA